MMSTENEPRIDPEHVTPGQEPSVLDWLTSLLHGRPLTIAKSQEPRSPVESGSPEREPEKEPQRRRHFRLAVLRLPAAVILAWIAQTGLERGREAIGVSIVFYLLAAGLIAWAAYRDDFSLPASTCLERDSRPLSFRIMPLGGALFLGAIAFIASGGNRFNLINLSAWGGSLILLLMAFWEGPLPWEKAWEAIQTLRERKTLRIDIKGWHILWFVVFLVSVYFRFHQWRLVPAEMISDHAEKLLDVIDVLNGRNSIYFWRNTGREALQFYLAAATERLLGTGITFETLKFGTILAGIVTLPYIYLFAREIAGREAGLAAMGLAGIGYWPNVISRVGLRFPLFPLFTAPALYYLVRGIRRRERNDFILAGFMVGVGLHGYSPTRILPFVVAAGVLLYLLHRESRGRRWATFSWLIAAGIMALMVLVPLLRIAVDQPQAILYRMATRMGEVERSYPGSPWGIFIKNVWDGLLMFSWNNGNTWVNSVPNRPALDWVTAALYNLGCVILAVRYVRQRRWLDGFVLLAIPLLQLSSTLSLAFPEENPSTNRASGALVPVFTAAGIGFSACVSWVWKQVPARLGKGIAGVSLGAAILLAASMNYQLVFDKYATFYRNASWNTSDAGRIIVEFAETFGDYDSAYVMAYPYWMDTRIVGMVAGKPSRDFALWADQLESILPITSPHLFLINPNDEESLARLRDLFPEGILSQFDSGLEGKDILIYLTFPPSIQ